MPPIFRQIGHFFDPFHQFFRWSSHYIPTSWLMALGLLVILYALTKILEKQAKFDGLTLLTLAALALAAAWYFGWIP